MSTLSRLLTNATVAEQRLARKTLLTTAVIWLMVLSFAVYMSFFVVSNTAYGAMIIAIGIIVAVLMARTAERHRSAKNSRSTKSSKWHTDDYGTPDRWVL